MNLETKTILITGGTGSFGRTMVRHLLTRDPGEIRIFSRDEAKQDAMRREFSHPRLKFYIGDVRDRASIASAMKEVQLVFHAAALKQVPSCEFFPMQAVLTNVEGSRNVIEEAIDAGADSVVCLSTDKAVFPVNAMGMTKALMEKVALAASRGLSESETKISCVRYGNVLYSRGSVIPLFVEQLLSGKPLTVTTTDMTRFLMPLSQAIDLVEFALINANQGDLFVRKAPACTVGELAIAMKNIFDAPNEIETIGIRHGEKIFEVLASAEELRRAEDMGDYLRIRLDARDLNYDKYFDVGDQKEPALEDYTSKNTTRLSVEEIEQTLLSLPEICRDLELAQAQKRERP